MNTFGSSLSRVAVIGNYLPRQCGIATFTTDLCESIVAQYPDLTCLALPVNDRPDGYAYPDRVRFEIAQNDITSYQRAADFLNMNNIEVVCLQHEYGIFGGPAGSHILALLRELRMPVVTTLHTILKEPDPHQRTVMLELIQLSDLLVVMSRRGRSFSGRFTARPQRKSSSSTTAFQKCPSWIRTFTKINSVCRARSFCSRSACFPQTRGLNT